MTDKSIEKFQSLPNDIQEMFMSPEIVDYLINFQKRYSISLSQRETFLSVIRRIFIKEISLNNIGSTLQAELNLTPELGREAMKDLVINLCAPLPEYFSDVNPLVISLGGDMEEIVTSPVSMYLSEKIQDDLHHLEEITKDFDFLGESQALETIFSKELLNILRSPLQEFKDDINNSLYICLANIDGYNVRLADRMLANNELLGNSALLRDGQQQDPTIGNWIRDFIAFSGGAKNTMGVPRYLSESKNVAVLLAEDKVILKTIFDLYRIFNEYPESLASMFGDEIMFIPFDRKKAEQELSEESITSSQVSSVGIPPSVIALVQNTLTTPAISNTSEGKLPQVAISQKSTTPNVDYDLIVDHVITESQTMINDPALLSKVCTILLTRIRGIRDAIDTRESLNELFAKSESGLDTQAALHLVKEANKYADMIAVGTIPEFSTPDQVEKSVIDSVHTNSETKGGQSASSISSPIRGRSRTQHHPRFGVSGQQTTPVSVSQPQSSQTRFAIEEVEGVPMIVEKSAASLPMVQPRST